MFDMALMRAMRISRVNIFYDDKHARFISSFTTLGRAWLEVPSALPGTAKCAMIARLFDDAVIIPYGSPLSHIKILRLVIAS